MKPIIEINHLWKSFHIGAKRQRYLSLRGSMMDFFKYGWQKKEIFWALKDIDFKVMPGDTLGIIGRNGAGKTTLLKILSQITPPTKGHIAMRGRVASLLEVGTGFHPELTGRENIFLNGSILGLKRWEIKNKFDEIVDFSGVEQFIDTPLKHYSSGMQLRLAFAVAAHLEPEILLIDEILAVGDAEFQKKCLGKMTEVSKSGRTVLFVSHQLAALKQLCAKTILVDKGELISFSETEKVLAQYNQLYSNTSAAIWVNNIDHVPRVLLEKIIVQNIETNTPTNRFYMSQVIEILFFVKGYKDTSNFVVGFDLLRYGTVVFRSRQVDIISDDKINAHEEKIFSCRIPSWFLNAGPYTIRPFIAIHFVERLTKAFQTVEIPLYVEMDPGRSSYHNRLNQQNQPGMVFPTLSWTCEN